MSDILSTIDSPADLKALPEADLAPLAAEIRQLILDVVSKNAGHLAPSLGAVELTLALHRVFDTPRDKLVWDVGHQGYVHKILTGRRDRFHTIRQKGGLSGYLRIDESEYDAFGAGHASTSISAALGMAVARDAVGDDYKVVAIIGDGSMTGGMAWEAINNAGALKSDVVILLNDNRMSISPNVGAVSSYFNELITSDYYNKLKDDVWDLLGKIKPVGDKMRDAISHVDKAVKSLLVPGVVFEKLGFRYFGPVDGHDLPKLIETMQQVRNLKGPRILHVYTQKGKGVQYAEESPHLWHGVSKFDSKNGVVPVKDGPPSYTDVFGKTLTKLSATRPRVVGITAAMASGCGLKHMADVYPERVFDVGIAEEHAVTFAAGMAAVGAKPVAAIYSTFLQRGFDQVIHDVALQNLPVAFALDRGGIVGDDGATHNGVFDLGYLRMIPNMVVMAPKDEPELQRMIVTMLEHNGPIATRYPPRHRSGREASRRSATDSDRHVGGAGNGRRPGDPGDGCHGNACAGSGGRAPQGRHFGDGGEREVHQAHGRRGAGRHGRQARRVDHRGRERSGRRIRLRRPGVARSAGQTAGNQRAAHGNPGRIHRTRDAERDPGGPGPHGRKYRPYGTRSSGERRRQGKGRLRCSRNTSSGILTRTTTAPRASYGNFPDRCGLWASWPTH